MTLLQSGLAKSAAADAYTVDQSLRFDDGDSAYLNKTFGSAGNRKTWTYSCWVKRGNTVNGNLLWTSDAWMQLYNDTLYNEFGGGSIYQVGNNLLRDPAAWYHIVWKVDTTGSPTSQMFVNGTEISYATNNAPASDAESNIGNASEHRIGGTTYLDGYLAEVYFIDGTALDPSSFAETDSATNQWKPKDASGLTFGTNGFYQKYAGTELATDIQDSSGSSDVTIEVNGDTHTDTAIKKIGTASAQFDGTGDYLYLSSAAGASSIGPDQGSFTIECWIYRSGTQTQMVPFGAYNSWVRWETHVDGDWNLMLGWDGTERHVGGTWSVDTWYHIALVGESGGEFRFYVDGVLKHTGTKDTSMNWHNGFSIGDVYNKQGGSSNYAFEGYIDELRISDSVRYVSNFTPSTTEFTPDSNTKLLMHMDGANDGTSFPINANKVITGHGDIANTRSQEKVGDSSIVFDGTGDFLTIPASSDFSFGTGAWTIEMWLRPENVTDSYNSLWSTDIVSAGGWNASGSGAISFGLTTDNFYFDTVNAAGSDVQEAYTGFDFSADTWYHVALTNAGSTGDVKLWVGGSLTKTFTTGGSVFGYSDKALGIGLMDKYSGSYRLFFSGWLDEIRVSNTERYTTTFPPQTTEFTSDSNTMLLIHSNWDGGLGADSSGNANNFTPTNLVATDQVLDSPTANYSTMNPLDANVSNTPPTFSEGNLKVITAGGNFSQCCGTFGMSSGKWGFKYTHTSGSTDPNGEMVGITKLSRTINSDYLHNQSAAYLYYAASGNKYNGSDGGSFGSSLATDDYLEFLLDTVGGTLKVKKNGTLIGTMYSGLSDETYLPCFDSNSANDFGGEFDFGQSGYEPSDTDYSTLCTSNLPDPEIALPGDNFNTVLYTGDGATTLAVTGVGFQPEFTWIKNRSANDKHVLVDALRGATKYLRSDYISAEVDDSTFVASLDSDGFTVGNDVVVNTNTENYVAWNWLSATSNAANEDGSVSSVVRANTEAGFSIVSYTGTGSAGASVGHGLSAAPNLIIVKKLSAEGSWMVWSSSLTGGNEEDRYIYLNLTNAQATSTDYWGAGITSSTFGVWQHGGDNNTTGANFIAYCFHSVEGYSKIGSYTGNGNANGAFVYTGFRPAYVMLKHTNSGDSWPIADKLRGGEYNGNIARLRANTTGVEDDNNRIDILSNGFKITVDYAESNADAGTYMYYAVAEYPFKYANAR